MFRPVTASAIHRVLVEPAVAPPLTEHAACRDVTGLLGRSFASELIDIPARFSRRP